jgi:hypothetical protein
MPKTVIDKDAADMRKLVKLLADLPNGSTFPGVVQIAQVNGLFEWLVPAEGELSPKARSSFGKLLSSKDRIMFDNHRFIVEGEGHGRVYRAMPVKPDDHATLQGTVQTKP